MKAWVVIRGNNDQDIWIGTWRRLIMHRFPQVDDDGFVWLDGFPYVHDASLDTREPYRPKRYLGLILKEDYYSYWRYKEPAQINMQDPAMTPGSVGITGDTIAQYSKSQHLSRLVGPDKDWILTAVIALLAAVAAGGIGYSLGLGK